MRPPELQVLVDAVGAVEADARAVMAGLDAPAANWQPDEGRAWSVAQCLDHLARTNEMYARSVLDDVRAAARRDAGRYAPPRPGFFGRKFVASLEPPVRRRFKAPTAQVTPAPVSALDPGEVLARYLASHAGYYELADLAATLDPNTTRVWNPFVRWVPMRVATVLHVIPAHDRRHLWQARNVLAQPSFPGRA
ncbi:MAG: DinB family protein [Vicinamibacterales bacterium]